jgi:hypothetical protein
MTVELKPIRALSEVDLIDAAMGANAGWADTLREMVRLNSGYVRAGHSANDALVLSVLFAAGGLQMYMPKPETLMYNQALIASRAKTGCPKPERVKPPEYQLVLSLGAERCPSCR